MFVHQQLYIAALLSVSLEIGCKPPIDELRIFFQHNKALAILLTETWLNDSVTDHELTLNGYQLMRRDRKERRGGGRAVYIMDGIKVKTRNYVEEDGIEVLWLEIKLRNTNCVIGCAYRAPDYPHSTFFHYVDDLMRMETRKGKEIIIMGDLNFNIRDKDLPQSKLAPEFINANNLSQMITERTRHAQSGSTLIDLWITSTPSIFSRTGLIPLLVIINQSMQFFLNHPYVISIELYLHVLWTVKKEMLFKPTYKRSHGMTLDQPVILSRNLTFGSSIFKAI